jgi:hypothetical protein
VEKVKDSKWFIITYYIYTHILTYCYGHNWVKTKSHQSVCQKGRLEGARKSTECPSLGWFNGKSMGNLYETMAQLPLKDVDLRFQFSQLIQFWRLQGIPEKKRTYVCPSSNS